MRFPAVAGRFYPSDKDSLIQEIENCFTHLLGPGLPGNVGKSRTIVGAVAPHAGYRASGMNAAHVYKGIKEDGLPDAYVIIGPDHYGIPYRSAMCSDTYLTPMGECKIHKGIAERLSKTIQDDPDVHLYEHSIEVQIPFLQYIDEDPHIVPIIMRDQSLEYARELAAAIRNACDGYDVIVIASSDLSHYVKKSKAYADDNEVLNEIVKMNVPGIYDTITSKKITACGYGPIATSIMASGADTAELLKYTDSEDSLGKSGSGVVGYGSVILERQNKRL